MGEWDEDAADAAADLARVENRVWDALRVPPEERCGALACDLQVDGRCFRSWGCEVGT